MKNVWIEDGCISCGACEAACPEVFEMKDVAVVKKEVDFNKYEDAIKESIDVCPVDIIKFE